MAISKGNLAVTKDGEAYNKLQRPNDYLLSAPPNLLPSAAASPSTSHAGKRKCDQDGALESKRARTKRNTTMQRSIHSKGRSRTQDPTRELAPRNVLPVLDGEGQLSDDDTSEALAYLRSVRSEASAIPTLLVAPGSPELANSGFDNEMAYTHTVDTQHVVYEEGTWIVVGHEYDNWEEDSDHLDAQGSCHRTILRRFRNLRNKLIGFKSDATPFPEPIKWSSSKRDWPEIVERGYPIMEEVLQMDEQNLYTALQGCALALSHSVTISRQKSCWIWTLLALTGDVGTLDHERISRIRDLGLGAVQLRRELRADIVTTHHNDAQGSGIPGLRTGGHVSDHNEESINGDKKSAQDGEHGDEITELSKTVVTELNDVPCPSVDGQENRDVTEEKLSKSDTDLVISGSEDEADGDLEQARARLLAQLGDRLVQSGMSSPNESPVKGFHPLSRAEAERQRQEIRRKGTCKKQAPRAAPMASAQNEAICRGKDKAPLTESDWNTRAAIDMILTVVAECYGQRDLLEFREAW